jgi:tetrahydromethanopterin S-methyltransferase subunit F
MAMRDKRTTCEAELSNVTDAFFSDSYMEWIRYERAMILRDARLRYKQSVNSAALLQRTNGVSKSLIPYASFTLKQGLPAL